MRGEVYHPFESIFVVDAWGYCPLCECLTPIRYRFTDDMGMTGRLGDAENGPWARWEPKRSWWARLRRLFRT